MEATIVRAWARRGPLAAALWPLSLLYGTVTSLRRVLYGAGALRSERLPVPMVVIGNLIAGGAGKTPATIATVEILKRDGWTPGIVSRGYGREADAVEAVTAERSAKDVGDEPLLMHLRARVPVWVGANRPEAARALLKANPTVDVIVCDDGLQHLALQRDVSVLVFDDRGAGNGWLLPAGPLREAMPRRVPARSLVLYNAASPSTPLPGSVSTRKLAGAAALASWWHGEKPDPFVIEALVGRRVIAAAGLARPERFFNMLSERGLVVQAMPLPDHHAFEKLPWPANARDVVITEKDAVKLPPERLAGTSTRVWVVALDFAPDAAYQTALAQLLAPHRPAPRLTTTQDP